MHASWQDCDLIGWELEHWDAWAFDKYFTLLIDIIYSVWFAVQFNVADSEGRFDMFKSRQQLSKFPKNILLKLN